MKLRVLIIMLGISCFAGYVTASFNTPHPGSHPALPIASELPAAVAALAGAWEGLRAEDLPVRLVVEEIRGNWATVWYTWGVQPDGRFHRGWDKVRALVFPDGKLFWRRPGDFTFQLSDDWTTLVGKREKGGVTATSLMRRVPAEGVLSAINARQALVAPEAKTSSNAGLPMVGWGVFYAMVCLYVVWTLAEHAFFAGSNPESWHPTAQADRVNSARDDRRATPHSPYISAWGRPT